MDQHKNCKKTQYCTISTVVRKQNLLNISNPLVKILVFVTKKKSTNWGLPEWHGIQWEIIVKNKINNIFILCQYGVNLLSRHNLVSFVKKNSILMLF